jgi:hypothetical protein
MDFLRNLFGSLTSGIIRLAVTVGILAAVYLFLVKPVLKTTSDTFKEANDTFQKSFQKSLGPNGAGVEDVGNTLQEVNRQVQIEIQRSFHVAKSHGVSNPKKLVKCIRRAEGNVHRIQRCTVKF